MAEKQHYKDRKRDPNPSKPPPPDQRKEQKVKGRSQVDRPKRQPAKVPSKKAPPRAVGPDFKDDAAVRPKPKRKRPGLTRGGTSPVANVLLRVTDSLSGRIADEAARLKLRQTKQTSPREVVTVEGNKLEVVARPEVLHPIELLPHQRDTIIKDHLRETGEVGKSDAVTTVESPDWRDDAAAFERTSPQGKNVSGPPKGA